MHGTDGNQENVDGRKFVLTIRMALLPLHVSAMNMSPAALKATAPVGNSPAVPAYVVTLLPLTTAILAFWKSEMNMVPKESKAMP